MSGRLTHLDDEGRARMVDVGGKERTLRTARASALVRMSPSTAGAVRDGSGPKGEVLAVARLAGIGAAKRTAELIPLAHPLPLSFVDVVASVDVEEGTVSLEAEARTTAETGVEMEAMTAAAIAALTVYDMVKGVERGVAVEQVVLLEKHGGRSDYVREGSAGSAAAVVEVATAVRGSSRSAPRRRPARARTRAGRGCGRWPSGSASRCAWPSWCAMTGGRSKPCSAGSSTRSAARWS